MAEHKIVLSPVIAALPVVRMSTSEWRTLRGPYECSDPTRPSEGFRWTTLRRIGTPCVVTVSRPTREGGRWMRWARAVLDGCDIYVGRKRGHYVLAPEGTSLWAAGVAVDHG